MSQKKQGAEEAHAYTPGLKIKAVELIRKRRVLPIEGEVLLNVGDRVDYDTVVARTEIPGDPRIVNVSETLGIDISELRRYLIKKEGDNVEKGELIAQDIAFFGLIKRFVHAPVTGLIESLSEITGQMTIREDPIPIEVDAYIQGTVTEIDPRKGAVIEVKAAILQGIFGLGGETHGEISIAVASPKDVLTEEKILPEHRGKVVVGGSLITDSAFKKAVDAGVAGLVVGGIEIDDLIQILGEDIGVAITGEEEIGVTLIITEGFGELAMSSRAFSLLSKLEGRMASINGTTQIRAGVMRPEVIIPHVDEAVEETAGEDLSAGMKQGTLIRIIRDPYFGSIATVVDLPVNLRKVESGSSVRVVEVRLEDGSVVSIPRANVEVIEE